MTEGSPTKHAPARQKCQVGSPTDGDEYQSCISGGGASDKRPWFGIKMSRLERRRRQNANAPQELHHSGSGGDPLELHAGGLRHHVLQHTGQVMVERAELRAVQHAEFDVVGDTREGDCGVAPKEGGVEQEARLKGRRCMKQSTSRSLFFLGTRHKN